MEEEIRTKAGQAESWYLMGRARSMTGEFAAAEKALRRAMELAPGLGAVQLELGKLFSRRTPADPALARWHYHKALQLGAPREATFERQIGWEPPPTGN